MSKTAAQTKAQEESTDVCLAVAAPEKMTAAPDHVGLPLLSETSAQQTTSSLTATSSTVAADAVVTSAVAVTAAASTATTTSQAATASTTLDAASTSTTSTTSTTAMTTTSTTMHAVPTAATAIGSSSLPSTSAQSDRNNLTTGVDVESCGASNERKWFASQERATSASNISSLASKASLPIVTHAELQSVCLFEFISLFCCDFINRYNAHIYFSNRCDLLEAGQMLHCRKRGFAA